MSSNTPARLTHGWSPVRPSADGERRVGSRARIDLPVDVIVDGFSHACRAVDLSSTGMLVALTRALWLREPRLLGAYEIHLSATRVLHVQARNVWRSRVMQAARFIAVSEDERNEIAEAVSAALRLVTSDVDLIEVAEHKDRLIELPGAA